MLLCYYHLLFLTDLSYNAFRTEAKVSVAQQKFSDSYIILLASLFILNMIIYIFKLVKAAWDKFVKKRM